MSSLGEGPPWFAERSDGTVHYGAVPERLVYHPVLQERGIVLHRPIKPGVVFVTYNSHSSEAIAKDHVVKVLDLNTEELAIYERLLRDTNSSANHTLPCEIIRAGHPLLLMPFLDNIYTYLPALCRRRKLGPLLRAFHDLAEGVEYLHGKHIAHLDLCVGNVVVAGPRTAAFHETVIPHRVYIIDYDTAKQFALGPGHQHAIVLPETQVTPPHGLVEFDPYSWDIYCLGRLFQWMTQCYYRGHGPPSRVAQWFATWLVGDERGCSGVCRCRPTARTVRRVLDVLIWVAPLIDRLGGFR
ncbi:hypothetical protein OH77DRAFT_1318254 [Trametes cingulata]|nr:hypothetical protein OH77DRAFT_1318254 [Trametes cingulata]